MHALTNYNNSGILIVTPENDLNSDQRALNNNFKTVVTTFVPNPPWGGASDDRLGYDGAGRMIAKRYLPVSSPQYVLAPGTTSWTPPQSGVYQVECYGSGGYGDTAVGTSGGGGGGGGGYSSRAAAILSAATAYPCGVDTGGGAGETMFQVYPVAEVVVANSGQNASASSGGSGGSGGDSGSAGADGGATDGGAGGGAAGPAGGAGAINGSGSPAGGGSPYGGGGGGDDYDGDGAGSGADGAIVLTAQNASSSTTPVVGFTTAFDRSSNKLYERALHAADRSSLYEPYDSNQIPMGGYDSLDRLLQYQRGVLSATGGDGGNGGGSIAAPIGLSNTDQQRSYLLDSVGNWRNTQFTPAGSTQQTEIRQHNGLNQITRIQNVVTGMIPPFYDPNGNLTSYGVLSYQWDALNRLAVAGGVLPSGEYYYDALNRRIRKIAGDTTTDFIYMGWRCLEDRNPSGGEDEATDTPIIQYIWGIYLDELLQITTLVDITTGEGDVEQVYPAGTYYPLQDLLYRTTATTDGSGNIVEAYDFDAYGNTLIFNAPDGDGNWWGDLAVQVGTSLCQFLFTGQRFDAETGFYYYKWRYYWPMLGRFLSRDPVDYSEGPNVYQYCSSAPLGLVDPEGRAAGGDNYCAAVAHSLIEFFIATGAFFAGNRTYTNSWLSTIVSGEHGNLARLGNDTQLRPDAVVVEPTQAYVYEIKPKSYMGLRRGEAIAQMGRYIRALNAACVNSVAGNCTHSGTVAKSPIAVPNCGQLTWTCYHGLIFYQYVKPSQQTQQKVTVPVPAPVATPNAAPVPNTAPAPNPTPVPTNPPESYWQWWNRNVVPWLSNIQIY